jgi:hypothetical protein
MQWRRCGVLKWLCAGVRRLRRENWWDSGANPFVNRKSHDVEPDQRKSCRICSYGRYAVIPLNLLGLVELFKKIGNQVFELRCIAPKVCMGRGALLTVTSHKMWRWMQRDNRVADEVKGLWIRC